MEGMEEVWSWVSGDSGVLSLGEWGKVGRLSGLRRRKRKKKGEFILERELWREKPERKQKKKNVRIGGIGVLE